MKPYKPLRSSAPAHSILNAQTFHYRKSTETDIRKTFARLRRSAARPQPEPVTTNIRTLILQRR
jgi:hypothetical protein